MVEKRILRATGESAAGIAAGMEPSSVDVEEGFDMAEGAAFTSKELCEFLEADAAGDLADPEFKEQLHQKLWEMVQRHAGRLPPEEG